MLFPFCGARHVSIRKRFREHGIHALALVLSSVGRGREALVAVFIFLVECFFVGVMCLFGLATLGSILLESLMDSHSMRQCDAWGHLESLARVM